MIEEVIIFELFLIEIELECNIKEGKEEDSFVEKCIEEEVCNKVEDKKEVDNEEVGNKVEDKEEGCNEFETKEDICNEFEDNEEVCNKLVINE